MSKYIIYLLISAFIKMNVLIATLYIIGTNTNNGVYTFTLGLLGIVWIIFPVVEWFINDIKEKTKCLKNK